MLHRQVFIVKPCSRIAFHQIQAALVRAQCTKVVPNKLWQNFMVSNPQGGRSPNTNAGSGILPADDRGWLFEPTAPSTLFQEIYFFSSFCLFLFARAMRT